MKLSKFPVTAADGTEFRVSIHEREPSMFGYFTKVVLYKQRRKRGPFRFKKVGEITLWDGDKEDRAVFDRNNPDYITLSAYVIKSYYAELAEIDEEVRRLDELESRRTSAAEAFTNWSGRISQINDKGAN